MRTHKGHFTQTDSIAVLAAVGKSEKKLKLNRGWIKITSKGVFRGKTRTIVRNAAKLYS